MMNLRINGEEVDENDPQAVKRALRSLRWTAIFLLAGLGCCIFLTVGRFVCERSKNVCEFQKRHIWELSYVTKERVPLSSVKNAYVTTHHGSKRDSYQVKIELDNGRRSLFSWNTDSYGTHVRHASRINEYLQSQEEYLEVKEDLLIFLVPVIFLLVGSVFAVYIPSRLKKRLQELKKTGPDLPSRDS